MSVNNMLNAGLILEALTGLCERYEKTAPTVAEWADGLYQRINEKPDNVRMTELNLAVWLSLPEDGNFVHPSQAANAVYKLMSRLGQNTTGHAGF